MRKIKLYDTYEGKVREFTPLVEGEVSIYYCGPTVYNYVHVGNLRPVLVFDLLNRVLRECGYKVHMISNYTDIDDKIIKKALEENKTEKEISEFYTKAYEDVLSGLNIIPLEYHPKVSDYIPQIVDFISTILDKGHAYKTPSGDVNFSTEDDENYGSLSKVDLSKLRTGYRIETKDDKKSPLDFALWKLTDDKGIKFDTKLGLGRPGWHTECVVMINSYFKKPLIDIHGGGFDLKFPHHENEMAQSWAYSGTNLANYWMHVGFLNMNGDKMSKSLGNVVLANDALNKFGGNVLRQFFLTTYYRSPINYTDEAMQTASEEVDKYQRLLTKFEAKAFLEDFKYEGTIDSDSYNQFLDYLADDLNVANAITVLSTVIKKANNALRNPRTSKEELSIIYLTLRKMLEVLGFNFENFKGDDELKKIYSSYLDAKSNKDFALSDELRKVLMEKGVL